MEGRELTGDAADALRSGGVPREKLDADQHRQRSAVAARAAARIHIIETELAIEAAGAQVRQLEIALDEGLPLLVLSFHSPSLAPGYTPYVRSEDDLDALYDWWRTVFAYLRQRGLAPATVREIVSSVELA